MPMIACRILSVMLDSLKVSDISRLSSNTYRDAAELGVFRSIQGPRCIGHSGHTSVDFALSRRHPLEVIRVNRLLAYLGAGLGPAWSRRRRFRADWCAPAGSWLWYSRR